MSRPRIRLRKPQHWTSWKFRILFDDDSWGPWTELPEENEFVEIDTTDKEMPTIELGSERSTIAAEE